MCVWGGGGGGEGGGEGVGAPMTSLCILGNYDFMIFSFLLIFFQINNFKKSSQEYLQTVWKRLLV